ncbi:MAG: glycoside hydrolase family 88 protein [bacterium]|nr:glycoside hydrolase family 88 protein [bacterium]
MVIEFLKQRLSQFTAYHPTKRMTYEDGLMLLSLLRGYQMTNDVELWDGLLRYVDSHIDSQGRIKSYQQAEYNIDNILAGIVLFDVYSLTQQQKYLKAIQSLHQQLLTHPRTDSGSFWHKLRYPNQIWLDGLYMGQVFYYKQGLALQDKKIFDDIKKQIANVSTYLWNDYTHLYHHAYDETKRMQWANPFTGKSPNIWSRSVGWYAMALVDLYELAQHHDAPFASDLSILLTELLEGMLPYQDPTSHMWYQVVDFPKYKGNYLETSGSAMLAYSMIKGANLGMLDSKYQTYGKNTIDGIDKTYLTQDEQGIYYLDGICSVAGLDNELRDGSITYYLSEKIAVNEIKGVGPYIFAKLELMKQ